MTVTSLLMIFGKIAERTGKVRLFLAGFVIFTMASVACGLSTTLSMLIFFRAVQAAGAAMSFSINTEIMTALPREMLGTASSLSSAIRNMGMSLGVSFSTILLSLQLNLAGYHGAVLDAKPQQLSLTISNVMIIAAALCILGAVAAYLRNRGGS